MIQNEAMKALIIKVQLEFTSFTAQHLEGKVKPKHSIKLWLEEMKAMPDLQGLKKRLLLEKDEPKEAMLLELETAFMERDEMTLKLRILRLNFNLALDQA